MLLNFVARPHLVVKGKFCLIVKHFDWSSSNENSFNLISCSKLILLFSKSCFAASACFIFPSISSNDSKESKKIEILILTFYIETCPEGNELP